MAGVVTYPSLGAQALLLIRLTARAGQCVPVQTLCAFHAMPEPTVRAALQALWDKGYVRCTLGADGLICAAQVSGRQGGLM